MTDSQIRARIRGTQLTDADIKLFEGIEAVERQAHALGYDAGVQRCVDELTREADHFRGEGTNPIRVVILEQIIAVLVQLKG